MAGPKTVREPAKTLPMTAGNVPLPRSSVQGPFDCWARGISAFTEEIANFAQTRLREDMSAWVDLAKCKSAREVFEFQSRFAQKTASEYFDEFSKMSRLAMNIASEAFAASQPAKGTEGAAAETHAA
jgi:hypothetical protein